MRICKSLCIFVDMTLHNTNEKWWDTFADCLLWVTTIKVWQVKLDDKTVALQDSVRAYRPHYSVLCVFFFLRHLRLLVHLLLPLPSLTGHLSLSVSGCHILLKLIDLSCFFLVASNSIWAVQFSSSVLFSVFLHTWLYILGVAYEGLLFLVIN